MSGGLVTPNFASRFIAILTAAALLTSAKPHGRTATLVSGNLRCEWQHDPLGIESRTPHFSWTLSAGETGVRDIRQSAYQILVASSPAKFDRNEADLWNSGLIQSESLFGIEYAGKPLSSHSTYFWKVRVWDGKGVASNWSPAAKFTTALLSSGEWKAHWIAALPDGDQSASPKPLPVFRHSFDVAKPMDQALLFVSGLGQYEVHINGDKITDAVLMPGWTDYRKRVLYETHDVTRFLKTGKNAVAILLGNGMYNVERFSGRYTKFTGSFGQPKLIAQLHLRFHDGTETDIVSDKDWKTAAGPILFSSAYGGEDFDARCQEPGWDLAAFRDDGWSSAVEVEGPGGELYAESIPPVKPAQIFDTLRVTEPQPGKFVYDLGQNFSGWPVISVRGPKGSSVKLVAGELLDPQGLVTQRSANAFPASQNSFTYTLRGEGEEHWHPRFSYYGFRYVQAELSPADHPPVLLKLQGEFIHDAVNVDGSFSSSDLLFNKIHRLIDAAILSNMVSVLTDCPHREKLGWLEQTHLAGASIVLNYSVSGLYEKISDDMEDAQLPNGMVPSIAPEFVAFVDANGNNTSFRDSPEWGSAVVLSPWIAYQNYGDLAILRQHYDSMNRYVDYLGSRTNDGMLEYGLGDWYDIGPKSPGESQLTGKGLTATAIYYQDLTELEQIARLLGKQDDAAALREKAAQVKSAFNAHEFDPRSNQYDRGSQTSNAMPLALDMVPEGHRKAVLANLISDIRKHNNHVTAGDVGFHYVVRALTESGRSDVLYDMLRRTDPPSYGDQLAHGATTLTEAWDTNPNSSQNHFMLGHAEEWFYRGLAGIRFDLTAAPDKRIEIEPALVGDVREASASYESMLGTVESHWTRLGGDIRMDVTIPAGSTATIRFPGKFQGNISEGGRPLAVGNGVHSVSKQPEWTECVIGSGQYHFQGHRGDVDSPLP